MPGLIQLMLLLPVCKHQKVWTILQTIAQQAGAVDLLAKSCCDRFEATISW